MVRPYGIKVNKKKERAERYDKEEDEEEEQPKSEQKQKGEERKQKRKRERASKTEEEDSEEKKVTTEEAASAEDIMGGIPIVLSDHSKKEKTGVVFVLEKASLEVAKVGKTHQLLNSDDHANFLRKNNRNPADYRPDITHQALLMILDSPVNKAGRLKAVYVRTEKGVLFEVKPHVRIPRTFKRFAGIMLQLLQNLSISAAGTGESNREKLMRCIKNPVKDHLPVNSRKIGFSYSSEKLVNMQRHLATVCNDTDTVFVLGAMAHGKIDCDYIDDFVSISGYPLSAAYCISRICEALATNWNII